MIKAMEKAGWSSLASCWWSLASCDSPLSCSSRALQSWCDHSSPVGSGFLPRPSAPLPRFGASRITRPGRSSTPSWGLLVIYGLAAHGQREPAH
jgi:hypothetical protein